MNKKLLTLGVAAAVGLAGFAVLPALAAANLESKTENKVMPSATVGKFNHVKFKTFNKVLNVDGIDFADAATYDEFKVFLNGKAAVAFTDHDTEALASAAPAQDGKIEGNDTIIFKGTFANILTTVNLILTKAGTDNDVAKALEDKLKNVVFDIQDNATGLTIDKANIEKLEELADQSGVGKIEMKLKKKVKDLTFTGLDATAFNPLKGKVTIDHVFDKVKTNALRVEDTKAAIALLGVTFKKGEFTAVPGSDNAVDYINGNYVAGQDNNNQNNDQQQQQQQQQNNNTTGNTQTNPGKLKAPDTGIVK